RLSFVAPNVSLMGSTLVRRGRHEAGVTRLDLRLEPAAAGEVEGAAQVAVEGSAGDRALVPGPRRLGGDAVGEVQDPARALAVELDELVDGVGRAKPAAQLGDGRVGDELERRALELRGLLEAVSALLPFLDRGVEQRHRAQGSEGAAAGYLGSPRSRKTFSPGRVIPRPRASRSRTAGCVNAARRARRCSFSRLSCATTAFSCLDFCQVE